MEARTCDTCAYAELTIKGALLNQACYECALGCDQGACECFVQDPAYEDFDYLLAS